MGRNAIITGASLGLGFEIAKEYIAEGANVLLCARNKCDLADAETELRALAASDQMVFSISADVSKPADVETVIATSIALFRSIDILVNNAGVYGPKGTVEDVDWDDWIAAIEINLYGSVLMCRGIVPHMKAKGYGKIVQISGGGATNPLPRLSAYATSKAAVIRFAETLAEELREANVDVNAIAPGALATRMTDEVISAGPLKVGEAFYTKMVEVKQGGGAPISEGARLAVYLGSSESDGLTGKLISALWDPWLNFRDYLDDLEGSDIYTIRRITARDRGKTWENGE